MKQIDNITDMAMLLKDFFETYLPKEKGVSNHTIRSYSATFQSLYAFFKDNKGIRANKLFVKDLSRRSINDYLNWLEMEKGNKVPTRNSRLASVKAFCHYAQYKDLKISQDGRIFCQSNQRKLICLICLSLLRKE